LTNSIHTIWLTLALLGCSRESMYGDRSLVQDVSDSYAGCNDTEIRFLSEKHNIQTAFKRCGSNRFSHFRYSPDGVHVYFQVADNGYVMNGENRTIKLVPAEKPLSNAGWLTKDILAVPLEPELGGTQERVTLYNRATDSMHTLELPVQQLRDLQAWDEKGTMMLFTAVDDTGGRHPYLLDTATGSISRTLNWLNQSIEHLQVARAANLVAWSTKSDTEIAQLDDGKTLHLLPGVTRAVPHPDGDWVALEQLGAPISKFQQTSWGHGSPEKKARDEARHKKWLESQPDWVNQKFQPPEVHFLNVKDASRYRVKSFLGDRLQWYPAPGHYLAFMMWGIEGKQLHRNVGLKAMGLPLKLAANGKQTQDLTVVTAPIAPDSDPDLKGVRTAP